MPEEPTPGSPDEESTARDAEMIKAARREVKGVDGSSPPGQAETRAPEPSSSPPPDSFAGYKIVREIHRGGQGVVYQAFQESTRRKVAIKVMKEGPFAGSADKARFEREVQILGQLKHPNIVTVYDSGTAAGSFFFVMDYISGQQLDVYMSRQEHSIDETLKLFAKICEAVNSAHLKGVIHRDLKPGNIRIDDEGEPHILDFGLAKVAVSDQEASMMTMTGQFIGSLPWSSPEQAEGKPGKIDVRTDVYSLGVMLYQMLTGKFPYDVIGNMRDVLDRIMKAEPARPSTIRKQINDEVETIVLKCLSKERERRYQAAGELGRDIRHFLAGEPVEAKRDSGLYVLRKTLRRYRVPVTIASAFVLLLAATSVALTVLYRRAEREAVNAQFRMEIARVEVTRSHRDYESLLPLVRRAEELESLLPDQILRQQPRGVRKDASTWLEELFPERPGLRHGASLLQAARLLLADRGNPLNDNLINWIDADEEPIRKLVEGCKQYRLSLKILPDRPTKLLVEFEQPSLTTVRYVVKLLVANAIVRHVDEDAEAAMESLRTAVRIARSAGDLTSLWGALHELSGRRLVYDGYRAILEDAQRRGELPDVYVRFIEEDPAIGILEYALTGEERTARQLINEVFVKHHSNAPPNADVGRYRELYDESFPGAEPPADAALSSFDYEWTLETLSTAMDSYRGAKDATFREIESMGNRIEAQFEDPRVADGILPNFWRALSVRRRGQMQQDATIIMVAIYANHHSHGEWPDSIDTALRDFRVQPTSRRYYEHAFVYRVENDAPLLYVVGPNETDDGGDADDVVFLPTPTHDPETHRWVSWNSNIRGFVGADQYRQGQYEDALATLLRANRINRAAPEGEQPADVALIAMSLHQLGRTEEAHATLQRLRELLQNERWAREYHAQALLREAEALFNSEAGPGTERVGEPRP